MFRTKQSKINRLQNTIKHQTNEQSPKHSNWIDNKLTAIQEHLSCCNYSPSFADFSILTRESNDFKLNIMESLLIARDKPILKKVDSFLLVELFQCNISGYHKFYTYDVHLSHCGHTIVVCSISLFCYDFYILSKTECKSIYYHFRRDQESSSFRKLARNGFVEKLVIFFVINLLY